MNRRQRSLSLSTVFFVGSREDLWQTGSPVHVSCSRRSMRDSLHVRNRQETSYHIGTGSPLDGCASSIWSTLFFLQEKLHLRENRIDVE